MSVSYPVHAWSWGGVLIASLMIFLAGRTAGAEEAKREDPWAITLYTAVIVEIDMVKVPYRMDRVNWGYRLASLALSRRVGRIGRPLRLEVEGQVTRHTKGNDNFELNGLFVSRWVSFPWNEVMGTSFAFGAGLSWASSLPLYEHDHQIHSNQLLAYLLWEIDLYAPPLPDWQLALRLHHRSGAYGAFRGVYAGSNYVGWGIKHTF
jgi:hypothetical protein